jgi:hypothetical protein
LRDEGLLKIAQHDAYGSLALDPDPELAFVGVRALRGLADFCEGYQGFPGPRQVEDRLGGEDRRPETPLRVGTLPDGRDPRRRNLVRLGDIRAQLRQACPPGSHEGQRNPSTAAT